MRNIITFLIFILLVSVIFGGCTTKKIYMNDPNLNPIVPTQPDPDLVTPIIPDPDPDPVIPDPMIPSYFDPHPIITLDVAEVYAHLMSTHSYLEPGSSLFLYSGLYNFYSLSDCLEIIKRIGIISENTQEQSCVKFRDKVKSEFDLLFPVGIVRSNQDPRYMVFIMGIDSAGNICKFQINPTISFTWNQTQLSVEVLDVW